MKKVVLTLAVILMAFVSANAQNFGIGAKVGMTFGEKMVTPMMQASYEIRTPGIFAFEAGASFGGRYMTVEGVKGDLTVEYSGIRLAADLEVCGKVRFSRFEGIVGVGYAYRESVEMEGYRITNSNFNPDCYSISGVKASAGVGFVLSGDSLTGKGLRIKVLANIMPCMVSSQKTMKPGMEIALTYYL